MIELRWVRRYEPLPHEPLCAVEVRVLQYREKTPNAWGDGSFTYGEWQDVPEGIE